jgi:hypothetical protein
MKHFVNIYLTLLECLETERELSYTTKGMHTSCNYIQTECEATEHNFHFQETINTAGLFYPIV